MSTAPRPPAHLEPYVRILGPEGAIAFLLEFGGAELYIPRSRAGSDRLAQAVGVEAAEALGRAADRLPRRVPTGKPWIARVKHQEGLSIAEIARMLHVTDVTVRGWLKDGPKRRPPDPRQLPLI